MQQTDEQHTGHHDDVNDQWIMGVGIIPFGLIDQYPHGSGNQSGPQHGPGKDGSEETVETRKAVWYFPEQGPELILVAEVTIRYEFAEFHSFLFWKKVRDPAEITDVKSIY